MVTQKQSPQCYICGANTADTKDHLFPKGLFPRPLPTDLPQKLPACRVCNEGLSKDEEIFRIFVASGKAYERKAGHRIWTERVRPGLQGKRIGLKAYLRSITEVLPVVSRRGGILGHVGIMEVEREPIHRVLNKIAKGFYFLDTGRILSGDVRILADYFDDPEQMVSPPLDEAIRRAKRVDLGDGVVTYWRNTVADDPALSITWLQFYQDKAFLICTFRECI